MAFKGQQRLLCRQKELSSDPQHTHTNNHVAVCSCTRGTGQRERQEDCWGPHWLPAQLEHQIPGLARPSPKGTRQTAMEQGIASSLGEHEHEDAHRHVHMYVCAHARTEILHLDLRQTKVCSSLRTVYMTRVWNLRSQAKHSHSALTPDPTEMLRRNSG